MTEEGGRLGLYVFILVLNIAFPVLGYTFTTFGAEYEEFDISLDIDSLMMSGINLADAESHNITWNGAWVYFEVQNKTTRLKFMEYTWFGGISGDGIHIHKRTPISLALNNWLSTYRVNVKGVKTGDWEKAIYNASIIAEWDTDYNWSRFLMTEGTNVFITPFSGTNITKSVYEDGTLNVTIAQTFEETNDYNFWNFMSWYSSLMMGTQSWGLPPIFSWLIKIFSALSILALILLSKELTRV